MFDEKKIKWEEKYNLQKKSKFVDVQNENTIKINEHQNSVAKFITVETKKIDNIKDEDIKTRYTYFLKSSGGDIILSCMMAKKNDGKQYDLII
jgi:hypothetical protein